MKETRDGRDNNEERRLEVNKGGNWRKSREK